MADLFITVLALAAFAFVIYKLVARSKRRRENRPPGSGGTGGGKHTLPK